MMIRLKNSSLNLGFDPIFKIHGGDLNNREVETVKGLRPAQQPERQPSECLKLGKAILQR